MSSVVIRRGGGGIMLLHHYARGRAVGSVAVCGGPRHRYATDCPRVCPGGRAVGCATECCDTDYTNATDCGGIIAMFLLRAQMVCASLTLHVVRHGLRHGCVSKGNPWMNLTLHVCTHSIAPGWNRRRQTSTSLSSSRAGAVNQTSAFWGGVVVCHHAIAPP